MATPTEDPIERFVRRSSRTRRSAWMRKRTWIVCWRA